MKTLKEVQDSAKKLGHCHCNMMKKCECEEFKNTNVCKCYEAIKKLSEDEQ
jgi:hypothetical protein